MKSEKLCVNLPIFRFCAFTETSEIRLLHPQKKKNKKIPHLKNKKHGNPNSAEFFYFTFTDLTIYSKFLNSEHIH